MNVFEAFHFIRPLWLLLLPLVLLLPWAWRRGQRPVGDWARVCDPHLLRWLSLKQVEERPRGAGPWLAACALLICILALAGPSWQRLPGASYSARDARVIVLDLSQSMLAEDLRPDRLTRARFLLADLLTATEEGQVGLVAYGGDAYVVSPLTSDMNTVANMLPALRPDIIPVAGSRADLALDMAAALLQRSSLKRGELLLVTDSATSRDAARARSLRDNGILTSVLAVGTEKGAPIPSGGGFVSDRSGNVVIARLERPALRAVAEAGGGRYTELSAVPGVTGLWRDSHGGDFARRDEALGERWKDSGPWLVLLLLPLALAGFRRGLFFAFPLLVSAGLILPQPAQAGWWEDVWARKDQQAYRALAAGDAERAAALARDPELSGEAWYRSGEFSQAGAAWSLRETADAHYNRGNALAHLGEYDAAIAAYDAALSLEPDMADARHNRDLVQEMKDLQQQQQQESGEGESGQDESTSEPQEGGEGEEPGTDQQQEGDQADQTQEQEQGETTEGDADDSTSQQAFDYEEAWSEEDAQAMEQWLNRIPDDPGGLLRRKFRNQHMRRGAPEDEKETW